MGRYYSGDIEGKFWFGVQPSNDADFFGAEGWQVPVLHYCFEEQIHKTSIEEGLRKCREVLGEYEQRFDDFFAAHEFYDDEKLIEAGFPKETVSELLKWYARLELGEKILKCVKKNGECSFEVEC